MFKFLQSSDRNGFLINLLENESEANVSEKADGMRAVSEIEMKHEDAGPPAETCKGSSFTDKKNMSAPRLCAKHKDPQEHKPAEP